MYRIFLYSSETRTRKEINIKWRSILFNLVKFRQQFGLYVIKVNATKDMRPERTKCRVGKGRRAAVGGKEVCQYGSGSCLQVSKGNCSRFSLERGSTPPGLPERAGQGKWPSALINNWNNFRQSLLYIFFHQGSIPYYLFQRATAGAAEGKQN